MGCCSYGCFIFYQHLRHLSRCDDFTFFDSDHTNIFYLLSIICSFRLWAWISFLMSASSTNSSADSSSPGRIRPSVVSAEMQSPMADVSLEMSLLFIFVFLLIEQHQQFAVDGLQMIFHILLKNEILLCSPSLLLETIDLCNRRHGVLQGAVDSVSVCCFHCSIVDHSSMGFMLSL